MSRRKKFTREEAAAELHDAYVKGLENGKSRSVSEWSTPYYGGPFNGLSGTWARHLQREWDRGYREGQAARKSELEFVTMAEVEKRVAAAIAELPDCKPTEEEPMTIVYHQDGTASVVKDGRYV